MTVAGVGVDIVDIHRMADILERTPAFRERIFTAEERAYCDSSMRPAAQYATHFAAREAVLKSLGTGFRGAGIRSIHVDHEPSGKPFVVLSGRAQEIAEEQGVIAIHLSLSTTHDLAVANAVAVTDDTRPSRPEEDEDPEMELRRSFKDARSILEELDRQQSGAVE